MLRNSFKFLSLVLAASLTVAPISAIGWGNSDSSRFGLGLAVIGLVGVVVYNYYFSGKNTLGQNLGKNPVTEQKQKPTEKVENPITISVKESAPVIEPVMKSTVSDEDSQKHSKEAAKTKILASNYIKSSEKIAIEPEIELAKKPLNDESIEKPVMSEIEPTISDETEKFGPHRPLVTLANLRLNHVEKQINSGDKSEQPNKITETISKLRKAKTDRTEHKYQTGPTALGNNLQFAKVAERNK